MQQEQFFTARYRSNAKKISLDSLLHRGELMVIKVSEHAIVLAKTRSPMETFDSISLSDNLTMKVSRGTVLISANEKTHVFDFRNLFYEGLIKKISPKKRAQEFADILKAKGVKNS